MRSYGDATRLVSKIVFIGLLISSLPVTLPVRAQQVPITKNVMQQVASSMQPKLSEEEIDKRIRAIKKTVKNLKAVNVIVPVLVGMAGVVVFFVALGVEIGAAQFFKKRQSVVESAGELQIEEILADPAIPKLSVLTKATVVALVALIATPVAAILSAIGLSGVTMGVAFVMAGELEQMEKRGQITLTADQKRTLAQLKNMAKNPITRGLMKYFALKNALKVAVATAMTKNPTLISTIAPGKPKKAQKIIAGYIKLGWMAANAKNAVAQLAKETTPRLQRAHKKAVAQLQKIEQKIAKLEGKYAGLGVSPELKNGVQEFGQKANRILEGLKKPLLEKPKPVVVPL